MNSIPQESIKLSWFMKSYFGHTHIYLTSEKKYVPRNIAKPRGLLHRGSISTFVTANPSLNGKNEGDPETASSEGDKRVCPLPILKMSHFVASLLLQARAGIPIFRITLYSELPLFILA